MQPFRILSLQNISYDKGVDRLVDLAIRLRKHHVIFIVLGRVHGRKYYKRMLSRIKREGLDNIEFFNWTDDIKAELKKCDLLIRLTRNNDPWGRDVIEALSCGVPVIATGSGPYENFIEQGVNGFLIRSHYLKYSTHEVARKIIYCMDNPLVFKPDNRFDGKIMSDKILRVYNMLLETKEK